MLVLASTSPYRRALLQRLGVEFSTASPEFDEDSRRGEFSACSDEGFARTLAVGKAESLRGKTNGTLILAADQIAVVAEPRTLLCKPGTAEAAIEQLMMMSGRAHTLTTSVVLDDVRSGRRLEAMDRAVLTMRAFTREEAAAYVDAHAPLDCVGSYRIEDAGIGLFRSIESQDFTGIIGLPLLAVARLLREAGVLAGAN